MTRRTPAEDQDDVALPFLSYTAGLMTAAEISKLALDWPHGIIESRLLSAS